MAGPRPKLPLEILPTTSAMDSLPDIGQEISPSGSILISCAAGPDPSQRLPISAGAAMAPLIVQSLYLDALEYVLSSTADRPWTIWAHDQHSFKYPVRWFALTTGKSNYQYQITVVTLATKARLQQTLTSF